MNTSNESPKQKASSWTQTERLSVCHQGTQTDEREIAQRRGQCWTDRVEVCLRRKLSGDARRFTPGTGAYKRGWFYQTPKTSVRNAATQTPRHPPEPATGTITPRAWRGGRASLEEAYRKCTVQRPVPVPPPKVPEEERPRKRTLPAPVWRQAPPPKKPATATSVTATATTATETGEAPNLESSPQEEEYVPLSLEEAQRTKAFWEGVIRRQLEATRRQPTTATTRPTAPDVEAMLEETRCEIPDRSEEFAAFAAQP